MAVPHEIGCGLAGGDWSRYDAMITKWAEELQGTTQARELHPLRCVARRVTDGHVATGDHCAVDRRRRRAGRRRRRRRERRPRRPKPRQLPERGARRARVAPSHVRIFSTVAVCGDEGPRGRPAALIETPLGTIWRESGAADTSLFPSSRIQGTGRVITGYSQGARREFGA